jgi:uncharacterized protein DUF6516
VIPLSDQWKRGQRYIGQSVLVQLPTHTSVGILTNMAAELLLRERHVLSESEFVELVVWLVPEAVQGSGHPYKYRLALVSRGICVLRYDNEVGKGDHKHVGASETPYKFVDLELLQTDFWTDVEIWRAAR